MTFVGAIFVFVHSMMSHAEPTQVALARAQANQWVVQRLGTPIKPGWLITGNIELTGDTGHVDLVIPVSGSHGSAEVHVVADREFGRWQYKEMKMGSRDSEQTIDLLEATATGPGAPR